MTEWKFFSGPAQFVDAEWYKNRDAAHHMEESGHRERLMEVLSLIDYATTTFGISTVSDFGCGDGGLLEALKTRNSLASWGYDLAPKNVEYASITRQVDVRLLDFNLGSVEFGEVTVVAEVLEHLEDPHGFLKNLPSRYVIASCPFTETDKWYYEFHLWAWDPAGFEVLFREAGWNLLKHYTSGMSQFVLAERLDTPPPT